MSEALSEQVILTNQKLIGMIGALGDTAEQMNNCLISGIYLAKKLSKYLQEGGDEALVQYLEITEPTFAELNDELSSIIDNLRQCVESLGEANKARAIFSICSLSKRSVQPNILLDTIVPPAMKSGGGL
ncbi:hypothetical protein L6279_03300 [Candidatus Parcubacteria bacterium]|nr:hypothetical protein [Candidatus Parcubacteria bacterium]